VRLCAIRERVAPHAKKNKEKPWVSFAASFVFRSCGAAPRAQPDLFFFLVLEERKQEREK